MSLGPVVLFGLSGGLTLLVVGLVLVDGDSEDIDLGPREFARSSLVSGVPAVGFLAVTWGLVVLGELSPATVGLDDIPVAEAVSGIPLGIGIYCIAWAVVLTLRWGGLEVSELSNMHPESLSGLVWYSAGHSVQASAEEVFFRGGLLGAGAVVLGVSPWLLVGPVALVFGLAHADRSAGSVVVVTISGILFGAVFVTFGLVPAALAHVANNIADVAGKAIRTESMDFAHLG